VQACSESAHACISCAQLHSVFRRIDFSEELRLRSAIALAARFHPKLRAPTRFPQFPWQPVACARALRMRLTRQRCQLALRTFSSLGSRRRRREGRVDLEKTEYPLPRTSRQPSPLTPTATIAATRTMHPCWPALHSADVDPQIWPVALDRTIRLSPCSSTSVRSFMMSSIIGGSSVALACRNPILPATLQCPPQSCRPAKTRSQARVRALP
jgi:hypothetical protein